MPEPTQVAAPGEPRCRYPFGDPRKPDFRFCTAPALEGRPYCEDHCARCYTNWRGADVEEAA